VEQPGRNAGKATKNSLSNRQRWLNTYHFRPVDRPFNIEFGFWAETFITWHAQGWPKEITTHDAGHAYFGLDYKSDLGTPNKLIPPFENKVLRQDGEYLEYQNAEGQVVRVKTDEHDSIPHFVSFPVRERADWNELKKRLDRNDSRRCPNPAALHARFDRRDYPLGISGGSLFGWIRDWMGFENACMLPHLDPAWFEEMVEHLCDLSCSVLERFLPVLQFDYCYMWEDMAFKQGPMMNPEHFERFLVPRYRRITDLCRKHGVDIIYLDCDGSIDVLVPLWLKAGVNGMFPLEMACGSDPVKYRKLYGHDVLLLGGVNKRELSKDHAAIDAELERLRPVVEDGGFVPHVDHRCPPDISLSNYIYYLERKVKVFGMA